MLALAVRTTRVTSATSSALVACPRRLPPLARSRPLGPAAPAAAMALFSTSTSSDEGTPSSQDQQQQQTQTQTQDQQQPAAAPRPDRALPAPGDEAAVTLDVSGAGSTVKLDALGPLVVNVDGTVARIGNWAQMAPIERENTLRIIGKRNQSRLAALKAQGKGLDMK